MIVRFTTHDFVRQSVRFAFSKATAIAMACALFGTAANAATADAAASAGVAASAPAVASATVPLSGTQYTVKAGQSLNDVAIDVTQSHDRSVLTHAAKALFDANPKAFMGGDPSRMRVGAVLNVPSFDATGNVAASGAEAVEAASGVAASGVAAAAAASAVVPASSVATQIGGASASATAQAASNPGATAAASAAVSASAGATGQQGWTGAIQQPASAPGETPASEGRASVPAVATASAASSAQPHVSSLQQLLALKNRVLMALQAHGFGPAQPAASNRAPAGSATASAGQQTLAASSASGAAVAAVATEAVSSPAAVPAPHVTGDELSFNGWQINIGALSAAVVALLVLIVGWVMRGRRKRAAAAAAAAAEERIEKRVRAASDSGDSASAETPATEQAADDASADVAISQQGRDASHDAATTLSDDAAEAEYIAALKDSPNSKGALMGLVGIYAERRDVARFDDVAKQIWQLSGGRGPNWRHVASLGRQLDPHNPLYADAGAAPGASLGSLESSGGGVSSFDAPEQAPADAHDGAAAADASGIAGESSAEPVSGAVESAQADEPLAEAKADSGAEEGAPIEPPTATAQAEEAVPSEEREAVPPSGHAEVETPHDEQAAPQAEEPAPAETVESTPSVADAAQHAADAESRANDAASRTNEIAARLEAMAAEVAAAKLRENETTSETEPHVHAAPSPAPELTWPHDEPNAHARELPEAEPQTAEPTSPESPVVHAQSTPSHDAGADFPVPPLEPSLGEADHRESPPVLTDVFAPPPAFPSEAISALNSLDFSLPPRFETGPAEPSRVSQDDIAVPSPVSLTTQPVVAPGITEQQAVPPFPEPPHAADAIEAGIAGSASVAGLGAARFGALNLNFDLDLPASTPPLPTFTPEELAKIARNKLDLAAEYIELGDIAGARTLINEVIESNDAATRNDARAMLSTLAPLS
ncbi:FimV/HubP family polar landmark protein [Trinickia sp. YCB016]